MRSQFAVLVLVAFAVGCAREPSTFRPVSHVARVVVLGDSVGHGAGDESGAGIAGNLGALNLAVNGSRTRDVVCALRTAQYRLAIRSADAVIVSMGGNDLFGDRISKLESLTWPSMMMARTLGRVDRLVSEIRRINPGARVYLLGLYNPYRNSTLTDFLDRQVALWDSRLIGRFAGRPYVDVVRIADLFAYVPRISSIDHFHPGSEGYRLIAQRIAATW